MKSRPSLFNYDNTQYVSRVSALGGGGKLSGKVDAKEKENYGTHQIRIGNDLLGWKHAVAQLL